MRIERARNLKVGGAVGFPADRGEPEGVGRILSVGTEEHATVNGVAYLWVHVKYTSRPGSAVWPSNRLR